MSAYDVTLALRAEIARLSSRLTRIETRMLLGDEIDRPIDAIVRAAAILFEEPARAIRGSARHAGVAQARFAIYYVANRVKGFSTPLIGRELGDRDHSTVVSGIVRAEQLRDVDRLFRRRFEKLIEIFAVEDIDPSTELGTGSSEPAS